MIKLVRNSGTGKTHNSRNYFPRQRKSFAFLLYFHLYNSISHNLVGTLVMCKSLGSLQRIFQNIQDGTGMKIVVEPLRSSMKL